MAETKEKPRAFRWLGLTGYLIDNGKVIRDGPPPSGVLHVKRADGSSRVVRPGIVVSNPDELASLGAERIEELVNQGYAILVKPNASSEATDDMTDAEVERAQAAVDEAAMSNNIAERLFARDLADGYVDSAGKLTPAGVARRATLTTSPDQIRPTPPQ
jgi:hypothetical protein